MSEILRNTIVIGGIFMALIIRLGIDWIRYAMRK